MENYYIKYPLDNKVYVTDKRSFYLYEEIINLAKGNIQYANLLIERATGQTIETLIEDDLREGEIICYKQQYLLMYGKNIKL